MGNTGNIFFPKLDFHSDQIYFKDIALDFIEYHGFIPEQINSEEEAKSFDIKNTSDKYPIYFFETDTSGEKPYEEFYTEKENFDLEKFKSLGFIDTPNVLISFDEVKSSFDRVFNDMKSEKSDIIEVIKTYIQDFSHNETGKHLDQKM